MSSDTRAAFLYKLEANCTDLQSQGGSPSAPDVMREHFAYLKQLHGKGDIVLFGLTLNPDPSAIGLCVFYADSEAQARSIMDNDPFIAKGVARGTLYPFRVALLGQCTA